MKKYIFIILLALSLILTGCESNITETSFDKLKEAQKELTLPKETKEDLDLVTSLENGIKISWESEDQQVISNDGKVLRPSYEEGDKNVKLYATLTLEEEKLKTSFVVKVLANEKEEEKYDIKEGYNPDYTVSVSDINKVVTELPEYIYDGPDIDFMNNWKQAGLYQTDGNQYIVEEQNYDGDVINVLHFGATPNDPTFDNTGIITTIIDFIDEGDTIYFPAGKYYFKTRASGTSVRYTPQILVNKSNIKITGDGKDNTFIVNDYPENLNRSSHSATLLIRDSSNVTIENLTFTSDFDDNLLPEPGKTGVNNPEANKLVPRFHVVVYSEENKASNNVINNVNVEYFQYSGIRIHNSSSNLILNSKIEKSSDIGGGGSGYAIEIRGEGHEKFEKIDTDFDTYFNVVSNTRVIGDHIRHGIILTYMAHNNFIFNNKITNTGDDGIDLHGQDEFLNYLYNNISNGSHVGAGLGLGNYGNESNKHDESGVGNVVYQNTFENNRFGTTIQYETFYTQVIENIFRNNERGAIVEHNEVKHTNIVDNIYENNENQRVENPRPPTWK